MWTELIALAAGLSLLIVGGDGLVRGASDIARRLGVAPVVIGLTVVAFGTSMPELVVNLAAALRGSGGIGFGNVVGSNIANIALILGLSAAVAPLAIHRTIIVREIPMMILAALAVVVMAWSTGAAGRFERTEGVLLLLLFGVFLYYTFADALRQRRDAFLEQVSDPNGLVPALRSGRAEAVGLPGLWLPLLLVFGGLALLIAGGELTVRGATGLALGLGIPETVVGLTIVAVGTSLPELATSVLATRRGQSDVAVGNVVGSNIYNLLFVWGSSVTIAPSAVPPNGFADLIVMTVFSVVLLPVVLTQQRISRGEGLVLLLGYAAYVGVLAGR